MSVLDKLLDAVKLNDDYDEVTALNEAMTGRGIRRISCFR